MSLAALGALVLIVGVFAPLAQVDVYGSVSLMDLSEVQGLAMLAVGAATLVVVFTGARRWLPLCALGAWAALAYPLLQRWLTPRDESVLGQLRDTLTSAASDVFVDVLGDVILDVTRLRWGGGALLGGCVLLTVAAWRRR
jgi:hypothetical protein